MSLRLYRFANKSGVGLWIIAGSEEAARNLCVAFNHVKSPGNAEFLGDQTNHYLADNRFGGGESLRALLEGDRCGAASILMKNGAFSAKDLFKPRPPVEHIWQLTEVTP